MESAKKKFTKLLLYSAVGVLFVGVIVIMVFKDVSSDVAKGVIWTTVSAVVVLGANMPMFWRFRTQPRFWVVSVAVLAVHVAIYLILLPQAIGLSVVVLGLFLPVESALVYLAFHKALRREPRPSPGQRT